MIILGFTGTQRGMTPAQSRHVTELLRERKVGVLHLGDCVGADKEAHAIACSLGIQTIGHPPDDDSKRAFCTYFEEWPPKPYLARNADIVLHSLHGLIACPKDELEPANKRGQGTWTTVGYARKAKRHLWIVLPDGTINEEWSGPDEW